MDLVSSNKVSHRTLSAESFEIATTEFNYNPELNLGTSETVTVNIVISSLQKSLYFS